MSKSIVAGLTSGVIVGPERHRFQLSSMLGVHPYGTLWKAEDLATSEKTDVTLLFLPEVLSRQQNCAEELRKLLILTRKFKHPNALTCYGLFSHRGTIFLAFEVVDGLTLANMMALNHVQKLKPEQKQGLVIQVGKALDAFQREMRKSHSSVSPELIFISSGRGVRVMMIGWRHLVDELLDLLPEPPLYRQYQAPEGFDPLPTNLKSDVYAFAAVIYHLYAGKPAFLLLDDEKSRYQRELKAPQGLTAQQWQHLQQALNPDQDLRPATPLQLLKLLYSDEDSHQQTDVITDNETLTADDSLTNAEIATKPSPKKSVTANIIQRFLRPKLSRRTHLVVLFILGLITGIVIGLLVSLLFKPDFSHNEFNDLRLETERLPSKEELQGELQEGLQAPLDLIDASLKSEVQIEEVLKTDHSTALDVTAALLPTQRQPINTNETPEGLIRFQDQFGESGFAPLMQQLPQGEYLMGDLNRIGDDNERPVREITFNYAFAIGVHEVTFAEYDQFADATGRPFPDDAGWGREQRPVINVSWEDARAYARWLRDVTGQPYRLPTEAEWEYAARAGTTSAWWWGNERQTALAVCDGCGTQWDAQQTAPVGQLPSNAWGLKDMHGNVDEWVEDCYSDHYTLAPEDGSAMQLGNCNLRVLRGGSWFDIPRVIRSSSRYRQEIDTRQNTYGFRVAIHLNNTP